MIQKVVDTNAFRSQKLALYLASSQTNVIVIPDYVAIEMHRLPDAERVRENYDVIGKYPRQVQILKGSTRCSTLRGKSRGLRRRLVDERLTAEFPQFVKVLSSGGPISDSLINQRRAWSDEGIRQLDSVGQIFVDEAPNVIRETFSRRELQIVRRGESYPIKLISKIVDLAFFFSWTLLDRHPTGPVRPRDGEMINNVLFRYCLCMSLQMVRWVRTGRDTVAGQRADLVRNDLIDAFIVAYGTFFDGVITSDRKVESLFGEVSFLVPLLQTSRTENRDLTIWELGQPTVRGNI